MTRTLEAIKQEFTEGLSHISHFWGYPKGVGAIFAVLYLSPEAMSLDELVKESGLTKGAVSTDVRALARMGLVRRAVRLGDRRDYYQAETDFYRAIRSILSERQDREFDQAVRSVAMARDQLRAAKGTMRETERRFLLERVQALQDFFDAIDALARAAARLDSLSSATIQAILAVMK